MGLFTEEKKAKPLPRTAGSLAGEKFLTEQIGETPDAPLRETAGLTPVQLAIQQSLPGLLSRTGESGELATEEFRRTLTDEYDPRTSPYYEGLRQEAERLKTAGTTQLRRRAELGGNLSASLAGSQEASFIAESDSALLKELGRLLETDRGRKLLAAEGIQGAEARNIANVAAVGGIAEVERNIEQQRSDALYSQALQMFMLPFQQQAQIASQLMNFKQDFIVTGGGMTDLGFALNVGGQAAGAAAGAG